MISFGFCACHGIITVPFPIHVERSQPLTPSPPPYDLTAVNEIMINDMHTLTRLLFKRGVTKTLRVGFSEKDRVQSNARLERVRSEQVDAR